MNYSLRFIDSSINFEIDNQVLPIMTKVFNFFTTHLVLLQEKFDYADVTIFTHSYENFQHTSSDSFQEVIIRKNYYEKFNLYGKKMVLDEGVEVIHSPNTKTALILDPSKRIANLFVSDSSEIQVIDFIRDILIRLEEYHGTLVLHASAVSDGEKVIAIVGRKGAGKSTFLLDLVVGHHYKLLSGDKLLLRVVDGNIQAYGWPDYPSMGFGTIFKYPELVKKLAMSGYKLNPSSPESKILFPPEILRSALGFEYESGPLPLDIIILPDVLKQDHLSVEKLVDIEAESITEHLEPSVEYAHIGWHSMIKPIGIESEIAKLSHALKSKSVFSINGKGKLQNEDLHEILGSYSTMTKV